MPNNCKGDQHLVDALYNGHETAITEIYYCYGKKLLGIAYSHLQDKAKAEKIVLNILTELWDKRAILKINSLTDYLDTAVKHAVLQAIHRQKHAEKITEELLQTPKEALNTCCQY
ncbi:RNA polymerase sigma factor [Mucilaginibacter polytrichastri]|uniref:RNA polymerase sigma-70 region 2 domain-containing protein n=1 Tax=Mucilaginibacter polytrichastri TaxID=1302689 RepID=A0A1Q5ZWE0_9SPHI|nr:hypothetical protein [Mucilaginibacter polytrichastri]OKS86091.1 hypothetical protein RG47T_1540 [Mucilaginibacter polytrichastri]SFS58882.1 hypothetical protein SAMN04487890_10251 [Mucilaginibacter polytrichastri]